MGWVRQKSTMPSHSRPLRALVAFPVPLRKASSSTREHRIQKDSLWGGLQLFIKQANMFPPRKF